MRATFAAAWARLSLKSRVALLATALLSVALAGTALALTAAARGSLVEEIDAQHEQLLSIVRARVAAGADGRIALEPSGAESNLVQVLEPSSRTVLATSGLPERPLLALFEPGRRHVHRTRSLSLNEREVERWRVTGERMSARGGDVDVFVATSLQLSDRTIDRLRVKLVVGLPLLLGVLAAIAWLTTRWALAPVDRVAREVDAMSVIDPQTRLSEPERQDEIGHLVRTTNALLSRVADARQRERQFAAVASHDLRTPLTTARLSLEIADADPTHENLTRAVSDALTEVGRLEHLARDLLELTRLDRTRVQSRMERIDVAALVRDEVRIRRRHSPQLDYRAPEAGEVHAECVDTLVLRVLRNLLDNAERHATSLIECTVTRRDDMVEVRVHNDGSTIDPADHRRIFKPFTRIDNSRASNTGGTGLGLAIALEIVNMHGGRIGVTADGRPGATFTFNLPATRH